MRVLFKLELDSEHEKKFIEMCEYLYPHYRFSFSNDNAEIGIMDVNIDEWGTGEGFDFKTGSFHWFEFLMRFICIGIDSIYSREILEYYRITNNTPLHVWERRPFLDFWSICNGTHPKRNLIGFAYERFKELTDPTQLTELKVKFGVKT